MKKNIFFSIGLCLLMGTTAIDATAVANVYTSQLKAVKSAEGKYEVSFVLNAAATDVVMNIYSGTETLKTLDLGAFAQGSNTASIDLTDLTKAGLTWSLTATGAATADAPVKLTDDANMTLKFTSPRGIAVDNSTESPYFGRVYVCESKAGTVGRTTANGLYVLDPALTDVTGQGNTSYAGGITWGSSSSPMRPAVAADGTLYLTDWSDTHAGIWKVDPADLTKAFTPVFGGTLNSDGLASKDGVAIHGSIASCWVKGTGDNTVLYTVDEDYTGTGLANKGGILQYNIGSLATPWEAAPSAVVYDNADNLEQNFNSVIVPDSKGGWWISQYRGTDAATIPSLIYVKENAVLFNSGDEPTLIGNSYRGGMALSADESMIAMGCNKAVKVYDVAFNEGKPALKLKYTISTGWTDSYGLAFDAAGNLYLSAYNTPATGGFVAAWALPKTTNSCTVKAPSASILAGVVPTGITENETKVVVSPNPLRNELSISAGSALGEVSVYSAAGVQVYHNAHVSASQLTVDAVSWAKGMYIVKVANKIVKIVK